MLVIVRRKSQGKGHAIFSAIEDFEDTQYPAKKICFSPGETTRIYTSDFSPSELIEDYNTVVLHSNVDFDTFKTRLSQYIDDECGEFSLSNNNCAKLSYNALKKCADIDLGLEEKSKIKCKHLWTGFFAPVKIMTPSEYLQAAKEYKRSQITVEDQEKYDTAYRLLSRWQSNSNIEIKNFCDDLLNKIAEEKLSAPERINSFTLLLNQTNKLLDTAQPTQEDLDLYHKMFIKIMGHEPKNLIAFANCLRVSTCLSNISWPPLAYLFPQLFFNPYCLFPTLAVNMGSCFGGHLFEQYVYNDPHYQVDRKLVRTMHTALFEKKSELKAESDQSNHDDEPSRTPLLMSHH